MTKTWLKKAIDAAPIDLAKLGWTEFRDDKHIFSYIRGYIWKNYGVRIKPPLDFIVYCIIIDVLDDKAENLKEKKLEELRKCLL